MAEMTRYRPVFYQERKRPVDSIDSRPVEPAYSSSGFSGWTSVRPVLSELMYTQFLMLKKPDFSPVPDFSGQTVQSNPGFKTLKEIELFQHNTYDV